MLAPSRPMLEPSTRRSVSIARVGAALIAGRMTDKQDGYEAIAR